MDNLPIRYLVASSIISAMMATLGCGDDGDSQFGVYGVARGILGPISLRLEYAGSSEMVTVSSDGPFGFDSRLADGAAYAVTLMDAPPCVLQGENGPIAGADGALELTCDGVAALSSLVIDGSRIPDFGFSPAQLEYAIDTSLLHQQISVAVEAVDTNATIMVDDEAVASGSASEPLPLAFGSNSISILVKHPIGLERTYRLTIRRAPELAQLGYGKPSNTSRGIQFGHYIAVNGDTLAVSAYLEPSSATGVGGNQGDNRAAGSGAVYVFRRTGDAWAQEAYIKASNTGANDYFGMRVAVSGDTLAVSASQEDSHATGVGGDELDNSASTSGAVYIFRRTDVGWAQEAYIKASNTGANDYFGLGLGLDGDTLAVGAVGEASAATGIGGEQADNSAQDSGAVYVFRRTGTAWTQEAYIKASNTGAGDYFGWSLSLSGDALAVSAYSEDSGATGIGGDQADDGATDSGAVYLFRNSGGSWAQEAYIKASNTDAGDAFGASVSMSGDVLAVGAPGEAAAAAGIGGDQADNSAPRSGAVYLFRHTGDSWAQEAYIKASNPDAGDELGFAVAASGDLLAAGARKEASSATGIDGDQADNSVAASGAVYLYRQDSRAWSQEAYIKASNTGAGDSFGSSLALSRSTLVIGASGEASSASGIDGNQDNDSAASSGAVYIFH